MDWIKNRTVQKYAVIGFLGGSLLLISGIWFEFIKEHLPLEWWSFPYLHRAEPMIFILDPSLVLFAILACLAQRSSHIWFYYAVIVHSIDNNHRNADRGIITHLLNKLINQCVCIMESLRFS